MKDLNDASVAERITALRAKTTLSVIAVRYDVPDESPDVGVFMYCGKGEHLELLGLAELAAKDVGEEVKTHMLLKDIQE